VRSILLYQQCLMLLHNCSVFNQEQHLHIGVTCSHQPSTTMASSVPNSTIRTSRNRIRKRLKLPQKDCGLRGP